MKTQIKCVRCGCENKPLVKKDGIVAYVAYCPCGHSVRVILPNRPAWEVATRAIDDEWAKVNSPKKVLSRLEEQRLELEHRLFVIKALQTEILSGGSGSSTIEKLERSAVYKRKLFKGVAPLKDIVASIFNGGR